MRVLDFRNIQVREEVIISGESPNRVIFRGDICICNEADDYTRVVPFLFGAATLSGKKVAWIGGGFCVGPMAFAIADCKQTVYEGEPALEEFCPAGITFIPGDWHDTISGKFDIVVFDLGGPVPREALAKFLAPGGVILPEEV